MVSASPSASLPAVAAAAPITRPPMLALDLTGRRTSIVPPPPLALVRDYNPLTPTSSISSRLTHSSTTYASRSAEEVGEIEISSACFHDGDPDDMTASNTPTVPEAKYSSLVTKSGYETRDVSLMTTASFIHPFDSMYDERDDGSVNAPSPERHQPVSSFDFDSLPTLSRMPLVEPPSAPETVSQRACCSHLSPDSLLAHAQDQCLSNGRSMADRFSEKLVRPALSHRDGSQDTTLDNKRSRWNTLSSATAVHTQFNKVRAVPAFASPLTRVLSPVVVRAQWEIVVRSGFVALLICWVILGSLLAVPVYRR
jgi:hypothetical protein